MLINAIFAIFNNQYICISIALAVLIIFGFRQLAILMDSIDMPNKEKKKEAKFMQKKLRRVQFYWRSLMTESAKIADISLGGAITFLPFKEEITIRSVSTGLRETAKKHFIDIDLRFKNASYPKNQLKTNFFNKELFCVRKLR
ncbi:hypothetical protein XENTR_v10015908 [Xenopus tropicalis]|nr:hypothetical protein XENTR_v10015908 [Xenopus tropicalis]